MTELNTDLVEQTKALFDVEPPADEVYADTEEVTVTLTRGQAYLIRGTVRAGASDYLGNVDLLERGFPATDEQIADLNETLDLLVGIDRAMEQVAPDAVAV